MLQIMLKKYGTDFHILSSFFPKKTKNQIKVIHLLFRTNINKLCRCGKNSKRQKILN